MATSSVWIAVASILATFDITKAVGEDGKVIEPNHDYMSAIVTYAQFLEISKYTHWLTPACRSHSSAQSGLDHKKLWI
jgi:hypothetical protein